MLATLSDMGTPVFALVDLDPHEIEIMTTARFGSQAMAHEGPALCVEGLRWLGVGFWDVDEVIRAEETSHHHKVKQNHNAGQPPDPGGRVYTGHCGGRHTTAVASAATTKGDSGRGEGAAAIERGESPQGS